MHTKRTADRLFGGDYQWSVVGAGRHQMFVAVESAVLGGHVRVGLEDSLWIGKGQLASIERRAGREDPPDSRGARAGSRDAGRRPADAQIERRAQRRLLNGAARVLSRDVPACATARSSR